MRRATFGPGSDEHLQAVSEASYVEVPLSWQRASASKPPPVSERSSLRSTAAAARRLGFERILGPIVLGIAAAHVLAHVGVRAAPEAGKIARHLHGALRRGEKFEGDGHAAAADARRV